MRRRAFLAIAGGFAAASTQASTVRALTVPIYRQQHTLTCEAASLRMALGAMGIDVSELDILNRLARDPTPRQVLPDGTVIWGDPDTGFVGAFDGIFAKDGYGVYDGPICDVAQSFGLTGSSHTQWADPHAIYAAVQQGLPVLVWVPYALAVRGYGEWWTPDGKPVPYVITEHCVVLVGVTDNGVDYADPYTAELASASYADFEAAFAAINNRAVIVSY